MKFKVSSLLSRATVLALFATPFCSINAQEVYSATIGAVAVKVPKQSDVMVALPFKQEKAAGGTVTAVNSAVVSFGTSTMTADEFAATDGVPAYYLYVEDGGLMGRHFNIVSNTASTVTLGTSELAGLNDSNVSIRAHWTLGTLFPGGVGYFVEAEPGHRKVEVIVPEVVSAGGGLAAKRIFYFYTNDSVSAWREVGKPVSTNLNGAVLEPGTSFVIRNNQTTDLDYFFFGEVEYGPLAIPIVSEGASVVDNFVAVERPLGLTLNELKLHTSSAFGSNDRLLVYPIDSASAVKNAQPTVYQYASSTWKVEQSEGVFVNVDGDTVSIKAGQGIAVRKAAGTSGTNYWVNDWSL